VWELQLGGYGPQKLAGPPRIWTVKASRTVKGSKAKRRPKNKNRNKAANKPNA